jgi:hypothetical protein
VIHSDVPKNCLALYKDDGLARHGWRGHRISRVCTGTTPPLHRFHFGARNSPAGAGTTRPRRARSSVWPEQPRLRRDNGPHRTAALTWCGTAPPARGQRTGSKTVNTRPGTAPLARGQRHRLRTRLTDGGNSPARAGTTSKPTSPGCTRKEQPRSRGDNALEVLAGGNTIGTAPLARGQHLLTWCFSVRSTVSHSHSGWTLTVAVVACCPVLSSTCRSRLGTQPV